MQEDFKDLALASILHILTAHNAILGPFLKCSQIYFSFASNERAMVLKEKAFPFLQSGWIGNEYLRDLNVNRFPKYATIFQTNSLIFMATQNQQSASHPAAFRMYIMFSFLSSPAWTGLLKNTHCCRGYLWIIESALWEESRL